MDMDMDMVMLFIRCYAVPCDTMRCDTYAFCYAMPGGNANAKC